MTELRTVEEAADRLRCGKRTVERWIATGELRSVKVGRRRLIQEQEIERFVRLAERRGRIA